jgi:DNA-binding CsgD family transcriptional regulator
MYASNVINSTGDPAFAVNLEGRIVVWNRSAESLFGHTAAAAEGQQCWKLLRGCDSANNDYCSEQCPLRRMAFSGKTVNSTRLLLKLRSRDVKPFIVSTLLLDGPGEPLMAHICRPDIERSTAPSLAEERRPRARTIQLSNNHQRGSLTRRQQEVLSLLAAGKPTPVIASLMCVTQNTVRNHIAQVLFKLNVHSRVEAVSLARQLELV